MALWIVLTKYPSHIAHVPSKISILLEGPTERRIEAVMRAKNDSPAFPLSDMVMFVDWKFELNWDLVKTSIRPGAELYCQFVHGT